MSTDTQVIKDWLKQHQISEVEVLVPDMTGNARGKFIPDQYAMLLQSGIDSIEVDDRFTLEEWTSQIRAVPAGYQRDYAAGAGLATRTFVEAASWAEQPHFG